MENFIEENKSLEKENEKKVNNVVALVMILLSFAQIVFIILFYFNKDVYTYFKNGYVLLGVSLFVLIPGIFQGVYPKHIPWMKFVLLPILLITVTLLDYIFNIASFALFILPTILCAQYRSKKYLLGTFIASLLLLTLSSVLIYVTAKNGHYLPVFEYDFSEPFVTFVSFYLPKVILYLIVAAIGMFIWTYISGVFNKQVEYSKDLANMQTEINTASQIQTSILPTNFNLVINQGYYLYASMKPAKEVGGDFYDFFYLNNKLYVLVGDVSDKGLSAAMFMMNVINTIRSIAYSEENISNLLTKANQIISSNNKELMYVTIWLASFDLSTNSGEYVNAGHCPAFIKDKNNNINKIECEPQPFIGVDDSIIFKSNKLNLDLGESLFIYTDGVTDAINNNGNFFGEEGIIDSLKNTSHSPYKIIKNMITNIADHAGDANQYDDITMLSLTNLGFNKEERYDYDFNSISSIIDITNEYLKNIGLNEESISLIDTAIDDAATNVIDYSKNTKKDYFEVKYTIFDGNFAITFIDSGKEFNPLEYKKIDFSKDRKIGGLGIHLYKNIMDECYYQRINEQNVLTLIKRVI